MGLEEQTWRADAACVGQSLPFMCPTFNHCFMCGKSMDGHDRPWCSPGCSRAYQKAEVDAWASQRRVCGSCPVVDECLEWALAQGTDGQVCVFGGLDPAERERLLWRRQDAAKRKKSA